MVELIRNRHSEKDGHAMDVLIEALRKQRVQAHIARELQRALARAKDQRKGKVQCHSCKQLYILLLFCQVLVVMG